MGTHAQIGVQYPDGKIVGCYVHFDGDTMEGRIEEYLTRHSPTCLALLILQAQRSGGMRSFYCAPLGGGEPETDFLDDSGLWEIDQETWDDDNCGAHYTYLIDSETSQVTPSFPEWHRPPCPRGLV